MVVVNLSFTQLFDQWPFQEPKWEVPAIYKAYVRGYIPQKNGLKDG